MPYTLFSLEDVLAEFSSEKENNFMQEPRVLLLTLPYHDPTKPPDKFHVLSAYLVYTKSLAFNSL
jgi:hypothetical protein